MFAFNGIILIGIIEVLVVIRLNKDSSAVD